MPNEPRDDDLPDMRDVIHRTNADLDSTSAYNGHMAPLGKPASHLVGEIPGIAGYDGPFKIGPMDHAKLAREFNASRRRQRMEEREYMILANRHRIDTILYLISQMTPVDDCVDKRALLELGRSAQNVHDDLYSAEIIPK